jgi:cyclic-di-GMP-binding biofilm dispersal mediator protein
MTKGRETIMSNLKDKNILVIGGSGVLGGLLVQSLAGQGALVSATATTLESATRIPNQASPRLLLDFSQPESINVLATYLLDSDAPIDGIVNASGVVGFGPIAELDYESFEKLMRINATGPIELLSRLQPALLASAAKGNEPFFLNISGVVAEQPMPGLAAYSASKAAIFAFNQAAARELRRVGIRVIDARPGHTETGLSGRAIFGVAPAFPAGMTAESVVDRLVLAIQSDERDLPAAAF